MKRWRRFVWVCVLVMVIITAVGLLAEGVQILLVELGVS